METQNLNKSYSQINGKNYLGKSGQNLFDFQYTKQNSFGVTGDYFRMLLLNRENDVNNVGEFLSDYYSTIKLIDPLDVAMQWLRAAFRNPVAALPANLELER